jgi:4-hydroxy-2-oxoglutarate aldolase
LWELCQAPTNADAIQEARRLQGVIALADSVLISIGVSSQQCQHLFTFALTDFQVGGMKQILHCLFGYGKMPRRPLLPMPDETVDPIFANEYVVNVLEEERKFM